jgi:molybdate transport system substrate-binding protein
MMKKCSNADYHGAMAFHSASRAGIRYGLGALTILGFALGSGCADDSSSAKATSSTVASGSATSAKVSGEITVLAAASLTDAFKELGAEFHMKHSKATVTFSFAASSALATQVNQGAPADVFASADMANMDKVTASGGKGTASPPKTFAKNKLEIIVGKGNPKSIASLADLASPDVVYVAAAPGVPIGGYAQKVLDAAKVTVPPKSLEADVKAIVTKVTLGEADAGIVYATDVKAAGNKAEGVIIRDDVNVTASYPIAVLKGAKNADGANAVLAFVLSGEGQAVLAKYGFTKP